MKQVLAGIGMLLVAACATVGTPSPELQVQASRTITCAGKEDCELKWARSIDWLNTRSHWKIRTQSEVLITTEGPGGETAPAFTVSKFPLGDGKYEVRLQAWCGNMFGCVPSLLEVRASFNRYVADGTK